MNKVELLGRLTKEPEIRYSQTTNTKIASFNLAVNRRFVKEGEERQTDFISIVAFAKTAEFIETYFKKGMQIALVGRIQTRNYEDNNGQKRYVTEVVAEEVYFAESAANKGPDSSILSASAPSKEQEDISSDDDLPF